MQRVLVNEVSLAVEEAGSGGPAVLFVHGGWTDRHAWDAVAPTLADRYRVICYDRRGHSQSERPAGNHGIETHSEDLAALIDQLGAAPAHVVTSSIGGNVALAMAVQHPDLLASLCLHEPPLLDLVDGPTLQPRLSHTWQQEEQVRESIHRGDREVAARHFFDQLAVGPGTWELFPRGGSTDHGPQRAGMAPRKPGHAPVAARCGQPANPHGAGTADRRWRSPS